MTLDIDPRREALEGRLKELVTAHQQTQQHLSALQVEIWKVQGKLELLHDLRAETTAPPGGVPEVTRRAD